MTRPSKYHQPLPYSFQQVLTTVADQNMPQVKTVAARPFVKWVGGKRSIIDILLKRVPAEYDRYVEPFLGGGALFFALQPDNAFLSDINFRLALTYKAIRDDVETLIKLLKQHQANHNKEYYLESRELLSTETDPTKIAALFIYLNKTCYNGLYRVNKQGKFNVPMGNYKDPAILDEQNLRNVSAVLQPADIRQCTFSQIKPQAKDFFYIDPPYHTTYDKYSGDGFGDDEHRLLANYCHSIEAKGGYFMVSNSDTPFVRELYKGYNIEVVSASRSVSCKSHQRGKENELLIRNY